MHWVDILLLQPVLKKKDLHFVTKCKSFFQNWRVERWPAECLPWLVDKLSSASSPLRLSPICIVMECSVKDTECTHQQGYILFQYLVLSPHTTSKTCLLRGEFNCRTFEICSWFRISAVVWFCSEHCVQVIHCRAQHATATVRPVPSTDRRHTIYTTPSAIGV